MQDYKGNYFYWNTFTRFLKIVKCVLLNESPCSLCQEDLTIVNILLANVAEMSKKELRQNGCLEFRI